MPAFTARHPVVKPEHSAEPGDTLGASIPSWGSDKLLRLFCCILLCEVDTIIRDKDGNTVEDDGLLTEISNYLDETI